MKGSEKLSRVLYIEDEEDIRLVAEIALRQLGGLETQCCASGAQGLDALPQFNPQLVLLDVMMPGMDGPAVLKALKENPHHQHIPVVFITAKVQSEEVDHLLSLGAAAVIAKPFDPTTIAQQLGEIWDQVAHDKNE